MNGDDFEYILIKNILIKIEEIEFMNKNIAIIWRSYNRDMTLW